MQALKKPDFNHEFRLGLVVYGGVSLAVYMNGVCREFYNAVRGRGVYKLIKALTDSDIVVDIISGTSAGGINGVLLSYALTNSDEKQIYDFKNYSSIWRDSGDISKLLRKANSTGNVNSFLDGEDYYQTQLTQAFQAKGERAPADDWYSPFKELDLFVTGTDVLGRVSRYFDNTGKLIEVNDHRSVFILKHREGRKNPFQATAATTPPALAKLCRITSCFPVAFPVVSVKLDKDASELDSLLVEWGDLNRRLKPPVQDTVDGHQLYFVDGGVLDNRPFSYTIDAIYHRHFYRPVRRKLFYVDPSPDQFLNSRSFKEMKKPTIWQSAIDSLVGLPSYESIAGDLQSIAQHNNNVSRYRLLRSAALENAMAWQQDPSSQTTDKTEQDSAQTYGRCRLVALRDRVLPLIMGINQDETLADDNDNGKKDSLERAAHLITTYASSHEVQVEIRGLDVDYSIRQHFILLELIVKEMEKDSNDPYHPYLEKLARYLSRQLSVLEVVRHSIDEGLKRKNLQADFTDLVGMASEKDPKPIYDYLLNLHRYFLEADRLPFFKKKLDKLAALSLVDTTVDSWLSSQEVSSLIAQNANGSVDDSLVANSQTLNDCSPAERLTALDRYNDSNEGYRSILDVIECSSSAIISQFIQGAGSPELKDLVERFQQTFQNYARIDQQIYPYQYLSGQQADDLIEITRISPQDANRGFGRGKTLEERLAGVQLGAFGGFFKKSWRSNDILWGRLDGLNRLVESLVNPESLANFSRLLKREQIVDPHNPEKLDGFLSDLLLEAFPDPRLEGRRHVLQQTLKQMAEGTIPKDLSPFLDELVELGQLTILETDLNNVFHDAVSEQFTWNQQLVPAPEKSKNKTPVFKPVEGYFDPALNPFATTALVNSATEKLMQSPDDIATYFRTQYHVGSERIKKDIPPIILSQLSANFGLVFRDILRSPPTGSVLTKSAIFNLSSRFLSLYKSWLKANNPATSFVPTVLRPMLSWIGGLGVILALTYFVSLIPSLLKFTVVALLILHLVYGTMGSNRSLKVTLKTLSLLLLALVVLSALIGIPIPGENRFVLKNVLGGSAHPCPLVSTPWTECPQAR